MVHIPIKSNCKCKYFESYISISEWSKTRVECFLQICSKLSPKMFEYLSNYLSFSIFVWKTAAVLKRTFCVYFSVPKVRAL